MGPLSRRLNKRLQPVFHYVPSWLGALSHRDLFDDVKQFCLFIGYPRSGHSLMGSLLDAHPEVVLAHELDALRYVAAGYRRKQLYWMIVQRDAEFTRSGRRWTEFDYSVPGQWQGRFEQLRVIGDKKGGATTLRLGQRPEFLDRLRQVVGTEIRLIHVIRNPFDNIATMSRRSHRTVDMASDQYFAMCRTIQGIKGRSTEETVIDVRHEELIRDAKGCLASLCGNLGLDASSEYLEACARVVAPRPHLSRHEVEWSDGSIGSVTERMRAFTFLDGYSFER